MHPFRKQWTFICPLCGLNLIQQSLLGISVLHSNVTHPINISSTVYWLVHSHMAFSCLAAMVAWYLICLSLGHIHRNLQCSRGKCSNFMHINALQQSLLGINVLNPVITYPRNTSYMVCWLEFRMPLMHAICRNCALKRLFIVETHRSGKIKRPCGVPR